MEPLSGCNVSDANPSKRRSGPGYSSEMTRHQRPRPPAQPGAALNPIEEAIAAEKESAREIREKVTNTYTTIGEELCALQSACVL